ncbi:MAG: microcompartment protein PduB, partial [Massilioclostridium sp.]
MTNILNQLPGVPEFVGTAAADTIGLVIANVDEQLRSRMNLDLTYPTIGLIGSRTGAGAQIKAVDDAAKMSNIEVLSIELPRDTKSGGGHGNFIIIGGKDVSDVRQAVELSLKLIDQNAGELYI